MRWPIFGAGMFVTGLSLGMGGLLTGSDALQAAASYMPPPPVLTIPLPGSTDALSPVLSDDAVEATLSSPGARSGNRIMVRLPNGAHVVAEIVAGRQLVTAPFPQPKSH